MTKPEQRGEASRLPWGLHKLPLGVPVAGRAPQLSEEKKGMGRREWGEDLALGNLLGIRSLPGHSTEEPGVPWEEGALESEPGRPEELCVLAGGTQPL